MHRLGIELTDRCNLACRHCLREINHDRGNFNTELLLRTLFEASKLGIREIVFTGGEPTLHPDFALLARHAVEQKLTVTVISNGQRPEPLWEALQSESVKRNLTVALSIEAADEEAFEAIRGKRTYRRLMNTVLGLKARNARSRFSVTIGPWNRGQWVPLLSLAARLGIDAVSVATYQPTAHDLETPGTIDEVRALQNEIESAAAMSLVPVILSYEPVTGNAGHLCSTLALQDLNLNHKGEFTFCCQLSTLYQSPNPDAVVVAGLAEAGLSGGIDAQAKAVAAFLRTKLTAWKEGPPVASDAHPCSYCLRTFGQATQRRTRDAA
jgi:MoaA/NifB/PqqE/SkfB family radical SAM enzyme